jgi:Fe-S-cluster-containing dehydrogenase component/DMSO reductase anchor subunit
MAEGFIFNQDKCVGCNACSAACILENRWPFSPRTIFTFNSNVLPSLPLINISLACNHCKKAVCLECCPSASFYKDLATGAIVIDDSKCIGCRYCQWNCPYDAPKYIRATRVIGKCNLCYPRLHDDLMPACTIACPTGALDYGKLTEKTVENIPSWFPENNLEPAVELTGNKNNLPLKIYPQLLFENEQESQPEEEPGILREWSLIAFSFLTTLSVAQIISAFVDGIYPQKFKFLSLIIIAGFLSLFHLGKKVRAWRAVINLRSSPISMEIGLFILYSLSSGSAVILHLPFLLIASSLVGLILLATIDRVYLFSDKRESVFIHSGQTFITALLIVSFLTGKILPFIFIAVVKLAESIYSLSINRNDSLKFGIGFLRSAILILTGTSMIVKISYPENGVILLFLAGEFLDRILFYINFKPMNINRLINSHLKEA